MKSDPNYPRMMFHRTKDPVTIHSREQEDALGGEWSRTIWPAEAPEPELFRQATARPPAHHPKPESEPEPDPEPIEEVSRPAPHRAMKPHTRPATAKTAKKRH